jgi:hypothetical protein
LRLRWYLVVAVATNGPIIAYLTCGVFHIDFSDLAENIFVTVVRVMMNLCGLLNAMVYFCQSRYAQGDEHQQALLPCPARQETRRLFSFPVAFRDTASENYFTVASSHKTESQVQGSQLNASAKAPAGLSSCTESQAQGSQLNTSPRPSAMLSQELIREDPALEAQSDAPEPRFGPVTPQ